MDEIIVCVVVLGLIAFGGFGLSSCSESDKTFASLKKANAELIVKYETMQCKMRGLDITTVKGITLCMDRNTRALHKIDETAD